MWVAPKAPAGMAEGNRETFGPIVPRVARQRWAEIKMPRPGEDRSDVGWAGQFNNIGPVPLSRSCPAFPLNIGPVPLSRFLVASPAGELP